MAGFMVPAATPDAPHRTELVVSRSRFIASVARAADHGAARSFVDLVRREFPDATHHCWAYAVGRPGDEGHAACSDDGEPSGTAGRPMLTVLVHAPLGEVAVVVTRYFGGIKLGTGGLVRAYQDAVRQVLRTLPTTPRVVSAVVDVAVGYAHVGPVKRLLAGYGASILREDYGGEVGMRLSLPEENRQAMAAAIRDLTAGKARITLRDSIHHT